MSDKDAGGMYRTVRYPRRFVWTGDVPQGEYIEQLGPNEKCVCVAKGKDYDGVSWDAEAAENHTASESWTETFDHHPQYEPEKVAFSEVDRLRAENETLLKRNETLQALLTEERERHAKAIADAKEVEDGLRDSIGGRNGWRESNDKLAAKISDVEADRDRLRGELKTSILQCVQLNSDLDRERGRADAAIERCKELQAKADACYAAEKERDELAAKVQELQSIVAMGAFAAADKPDYDAFVQSRKAQPKLCEAQETTDLLHGAIGLCTEAGELLDAMKKVVFYGRDLDRTNAVEELGDVEFYLSLFRSALGVDRETIINANIAKLTKRYKERFTAEEATNRDTAAEAGIIQAVIGDQKPSDHERTDLKASEKLDELAAHSQAIGGYDAEWPEVWETPDGRTVTFASEKDEPRTVFKSGECGNSWRYSEALILEQYGWKIVSKGGKAVR